MAQDCGLAATALLVTGEDPESEDGRRLTQVVAALRQVRRRRGWDRAGSRCRVLGY